MTSSRDFDTDFNAFSSLVDAVLSDVPSTGAKPGFSRAPGVIDVMGGIGEDAGSLVLTGTAGVRFFCAVWPIAGDKIRLRIVNSATPAEQPLEFSIPVATLASGSAESIAAQCKAKDAEWAAPSILGIQKMTAEGGVPAPKSGLFILLEHDFPEMSDLGRHSAQTVATADAYCRAFGAQPDRFVLAKNCADVVETLTDLRELRKTITAVSSPARGSLLQMRFHPNVLCELLELPAGIIVTAVATRLSRPTTIKRLIETRICSEMGHRVILELQNEDGVRVDPNQSRLSSITPAEYVERYRDRMPTKVTQKQFLTKFGSVRGLNDGDGANPKEVFKIRSRAEHHIYENKRVHEFATLLVRGRRGNTVESLLAAAELMFASHWSHSQRCGIGGVETDRLVNLIREAGASAGLFGAKVTAGGEGGEVVVLMRDDARAHAALAKAAADAEEASSQPVIIYEGALPSRVPPEPAGAV